MLSSARAKIGPDLFERFGKTSVYLGGTRPLLQLKIYIEYQIARVLNIRSPERDHGQLAVLPCVIPDRQKAMNSFALWPVLALEELAFESDDL
jgi:hypothetical protein